MAIPAQHAQLLTEADTCRELVTPKLVAAGWNSAPCAIGEQRSFTQGRISAAGGQAWQVSAKDIIANGYNLDRKNPHVGDTETHADPKTLIAQMRRHEEAVLRLLGEIDALVQEGAA